MRFRRLQFGLHDRTLAARRHLELIEHVFDSVAVDTEKVAEQIVDCQFLEGCGVVKGHLVHALIAVRTHEPELRLRPAPEARAACARGVNAGPALPKSCFP